MSLVKIDRLCKSFGALEVLRDISLDIQRGEVIALIGRSGSGKSTFLRCINGLEKMDSGTISVDGEVVEPDERKLQKLRLKVGMIFQQFNLFPHLTALDNTALALKVVKGMRPSEARSIGLSRLEKVGLAHRADAKPHQLSGGQQQRVAIARALAMSPVVLLCDEVTSSLDPELVEEVLQVIRQLAEEGMTVIMVTHEMSFAQSVCSRVVFMHEGRLHEMGPPEEVFGNPKTAELRQFLGQTSKSAEMRR
ncbi:amino acid ABC transporter ATP-binding protein [Mesorhizobium sp. CAU 1741]|uniref:amino acid ABC transporter ATP-binding protein n=1 Tax=Mesorhizobium sp. CAU 1741 TaxID=3140366 RepID=UPI00325AB42D